MPEKQTPSSRGRISLDLLRRDVTPSKIITKTAIENAITASRQLAGRRMPVLHLLAIANERRSRLI